MLFLILLEAFFAACRAFLLVFSRLLASSFFLSFLLSQQFLGDCFIRLWRFPFVGRWSRPPFQPVFFLYFCCAFIVF